LPPILDLLQWVWLLGGSPNPFARRRCSFSLSRLWQLNGLGACKTPLEGEYIRYKLALARLHALQM
jgi:hypothetical protein